MRTAFARTLHDLAAKDPRIWLVTGDLGFSVFEPLRDILGCRLVNVGVAEQNMMGVAAGLAMSGKTVFAYSIANFATVRCLEQIRNDVCYHRLNVKIVGVGGGLVYGAQGYTHHGVEDLAIMRSLPGMTVVAPGDPVEARLATLAVAQESGPLYLRLGKAGEPVVHTKEPEFRIGRAITVAEGSDMTLIGTGGVLPHVVEVARRLGEVGVKARVLSMHTIKPIDDEALVKATRETGVLATFEEHSRVGGLGSAVAEAICSLGARLIRFGVPDEPSYAVSDPLPALMSRAVSELLLLPEAHSS